MAVAGKDSGVWPEAAEDLAKLHGLWVSSLTLGRGCESGEMFDGCWGDGCRVSWVKGELT